MPALASPVAAAPAAAAPNVARPGAAPSLATSSAATSAVAAAPGDAADPAADGAAPQPFARALDAARGRAERAPDDAAAAGAPQRGAAARARPGAAAPRSEDAAAHLAGRPGAEPAAGRSVEPRLDSEPAQPAAADETRRDPAELIALLLGQQAAAPQAPTGRRQAVPDAGGTRRGAAEAQADAGAATAPAASGHARRSVAPATEGAADPRPSAPATAKAGDFVAELQRAAVDTAPRTGNPVAPSDPPPAPAAAITPAAQSAPGAAAPPAEASLAFGPGHPEFAARLGAQLTTFVRGGVEFARIQLHPLEMGPVTVQIQLEGQAAQVHFAAAQGDTRQALDAALPTLAGCLRDAGLTLAGGGVFQQPRHADGDRAPPWPAEEREAREAAPQPPAAAAPVALRRRGVVDLVA
ncbi:MAG: flagellar hook-length control protein FliK [Rubrivivax sp.]